MNTTGKKVSIVLPVYNGESTVSKSIESVLAQTYQNLELVIINDCSTDNTLEIISKYAELDNRVIIVNNETNQKLPKSLNIGFDVATGFYYTWTSDDNRYKPEAIEVMVEALENHTDVDLVYTDYTNIDADGNVLSEKKLNDPSALPFVSCIGACFLYTRRIAEKVGPYDVNLFLAEDYDFWIRIYRYGKMMHISQDLYLYMRHKESLTESKSKSTGVQALKAIEKNFVFLYSSIGKKRKRIKFLNHILEYVPKDEKADYIKKLNTINYGFLKKHTIYEFFGKIKGGIYGIIKKK